MEESSRVSIPYLPDEIILNCLARVSRLYYPTLSTVCKRFRSLIASLELHETRRLLGRTESCLYVCFDSHTSNSHWFTLCQRPTQTPNPNHSSQRFAPALRPFTSVLTNLTRRKKEKKKKSSDNLMISVLTRGSPTLRGCSRVAVGSNIYAIGGFIDGEFSNRVFFMDCRSHTWQEAPSMQTNRVIPYVSVLDGKIYVVNGLEDPLSPNLVEFFDLKTQVWVHVASPGVGTRCFSIAMYGKLYLFGDRVMVYKAEENKWDVQEEWPLGFASEHAYCVVENVRYCQRKSRLQWFDTDLHWWMDINGLEKLPRLPKRHTRVVNHGGKIAVLWVKKVRANTICSTKESMIWCAEIAIEKRNQYRIHGKIEWCDAVLTVPKSYSLSKLFAVNV